MDNNSSFHDYFNFDFKWVDDFRAKFYYSEILQTGISFIESSEITIYPNPTNDFIKIEVKNFSSHVLFKIFDISGKEILTRYVENQIISVGQLNSGFYPYQIIQNDNVKTGKLISIKLL